MNTTSPFQPFYCGHETDVYAILTSLYYIIFGFLGLTVNNSFVTDIHVYHILTGIGFIINLSTGSSFFGPLPLVICSCNIFNKLSTELLKKWLNEKFDENDVIFGVAGSKIHRLPVSIVSFCIAVYICFSVILYNIFFTIPILLITQLTTIYATIRFFPKGSHLYSITRTMNIRLGIATCVGIVGLITSLFCPRDTYAWMRIFIGWSPANIGISYSIYTATQLILLIRGKNLRRTIAVRGTSLIFITYYTGREKID